MQRLLVQPVSDGLMTLRFYHFHASIWILSLFSWQAEDTGKKPTEKEESDEEEEEEEEEENENEANEAEVDENGQGVNGTSTNTTEAAHDGGEGAQGSDPDASAEGTTATGGQDKGGFAPATPPPEVHEPSTQPLRETTAAEYEGEYEQTGTHEYDHGYEVYENENGEPRGDTYRAYEDEYSYYKGRSYDSYDGQNYYYHQWGPAWAESVHSGISWGSSFRSSTQEGAL